jgi:hypothetical protein
MHEHKIADYRAQAEVCLANAERTHDIPTKKYWIELAESWTRLAVNLDRSTTDKKMD